MSFSFKNGHDQKVVFTHQDQDLLEAFHKVKRFLIKDVKGLQGLVINVRGTQALDNCLIEVLCINGRPQVKRGRFVEPGALVFKNCLNFPQCAGYTTRVTEEYVSVLIGYHISFKYNTKVKTFLEKLKQADRFQQHCIINNVEYTLANFEAYRSSVLFDMNMSKWNLSRDWLI